MKLLRMAGRRANDDVKLVRLLFDLPRVFELDTYTLAAAVALNPPLIAEIPELKDINVYGDAHALLQELTRAQNMHSFEKKPRSIDAWVDPWPPEFPNIVHQLLDIYIGPDGFFFTKAK
jgi:hypothetical protein